MLRRLYEMLAWAGVVCAAAPGLSLAGEEAAPPKGNPKPAAQAEVDSEEGDEAPTPDHEALELLAEARAAYKAGTSSTPARWPSGSARLKMSRPAS